MDSLDLFIARLEEEFDQLPSDSLRPETCFDELELWDSMHVLLLIAMIDAEYDVLLSGEDLSHIKSVNELYDLVKSRL